ncbi:hypothetical protein PENTCL1PPCAC_27341, partial [Pristionchus entomophagus]
MIVLTYRADLEVRADTTVENLLKLANRFKITTIIDKVERYLAKCWTNLALDVRLRLADKYKLEALKIQNPLVSPDRYMTPFGRCER